MTMDVIAARSAQLDMAEKLCRQKMMLMMPDRNDVADKYPMVHRQDQFFTFRQCPKCDPQPKTFTCPACDAVKAERWQMQVHNMVGANEFCDYWKRKKQKAWASRV